MSKFNVGDKVVWHVAYHDDEEYAVIKKVGRHEYVYDICNKYNNEIRVKDYSYSILSLEEVCSLWEHKLADTKITRKLYAGKIEKEKDGYLWVKA